VVQRINKETLEISAAGPYSASLSQQEADSVRPPYRHARRVLRISNWRARVFAPAVASCHKTDETFPLRTAEYEMTVLSHLLRQVRTGTTGRPTIPAASSQFFNSETAWTLVDERRGDCNTASHGIASAHAIWPSKPSVLTMSR
jgi:hypothetical protein